MYIIVSNDSQTPPPLNSHSRLTDIMPCPSYLAMNPARPLWEYGIREEIKKGNNVLVVAHTNTLRGLMQVIDGEYSDNVWRWYKSLDDHLRAVKNVAHPPRLSLSSSTPVKTSARKISRRCPCLPGSHSFTRFVNLVREPDNLSIPVTLD
jgi:hypothetical protein